VKISVITVAYNSIDTIRDTLTSAAMQTFRDVEHLVIDGGSQDGTVTVLSSMDHPRMSWISEPDQGIYDAMNKGLSMARGEIIGFLNADDVYADEHVLADVSRCFEDPSILAMYGDLVYVSGQEMQNVVRYWRSGPYKPWQLQLGWMPPHPTFYVRRQLLEKVGGFDVRLRIASDYDFMLRCLLCAETHVAYVHRVLVKMRSGGVSNRSVRNIARKSKEDLEVIRRYPLWSVITLGFKNLRKIIQFLH
jgi:glycosyltransferase